MVNHNTNESRNVLKENLREDKKVTKKEAVETVEGKSQANRGNLKREIYETPKEERENNLTLEQKDILDQFKKAQGSAERVKLFAKVADDLGLDALISLIPELGDAGSSIVSGVYLLFEAKRAGLSKWSYLKIIGLQTADMAVGAIPVLGDVADYFFKANKWSGKSFEKQATELAQKARDAGVPEEEIAKINQSAAKWPRLASKAVGMYKSVKENTV